MGYGKLAADISAFDELAGQIGFVYPRTVRESRHKWRWSKNFYPISRSHRTMPPRNGWCRSFSFGIARSLP